MERELKTRELTTRKELKVALPTALVVRLQTEKVLRGTPISVCVEEALKAHFAGEPDHRDVGGDGS